MNARAPHPTWISPSGLQLEAILGDCLASPIHGVDVTAEVSSLEDPQIIAPMSCTKFLDGHIIELPFPLMDTADTNNEQTELGIDTVRVALDGLCSTCAFRSSVG